MAESQAWAVVHPKYHETDPEIEEIPLQAWDHFIFRGVAVKQIRVAKGVFLQKTAFLLPISKVVMLYPVCDTAYGNRAVASLSNRYGADEWSDKRAPVHLIGSGFS